MTRRDSLVLLSSALFSGCNSKFFSPTGPSPTESGGLIEIDTPEGKIGWSPYLVVQPDWSVLEGYRKALTEMKASGNVRGVRTPLNPFRDPVVQLMSSMGIEVTGIIPNEELFSSNPKAMIDRYVAIYPDMKVFQIGNEVTTLKETHGLGEMTIEQYMDVFKKIYDHVQSRHPSLILMTQSTFGSGFYGSKELKKMVELGLRPDVLSPQKIIVGINVYTDDALSEYISTRNQYLSNYRIWVMECGDSIPSRHISKVKSFYPRLDSALGAERIYWYALWAGDEGTSDAGYGLIGSPRNQSTMTYSPLGKVLVGTQQEGGLRK